MKRQTEGTKVVRQGHSPQQQSSRWNAAINFGTREEAEQALTTILNLVTRGQIEPACANSAIYAIETFLTSRKVAEEETKRRLIEDLEHQVAELNEKAESQRQRVEEFLQR